MVIFTFEQQNHTVTQASFNTPCEKLEGGMSSGFMANINNTISPAPQLAMQVTVSTPLCKFPNLPTLPSLSFNTPSRVLLPTNRPLRKRHDFLHQPHRRQDPSSIPTNGHSTKWYRNSFSNRWRLCRFSSFHCYSDDS